MLTCTPAKSTREVHSTTTRDTQPSCVEIDANHHRRDHIRITCARAKLKLRTTSYVTKYMHNLHSFLHNKVFLKRNKWMVQ